MNVENSPGIKITERIKHLASKLTARLNSFPESIPDDWEKLYTDTLKGSSVIPNYGLKSAVLDYYGTEKKLNSQQGRVRIIIGEFERSYHVTKQPSGEFIIFDEGIFPISKF